MCHRLVSLCAKEANTPTSKPPTSTAFVRTSATSVERLLPSEGNMIGVDTDSIPACRLGEKCIHCNYDWSDHDYWLCKKKAGSSYLPTTKAKLIALGHAKYIYCTPSMSSGTTIIPAPPPSFGTIPPLGAVDDTWDMPTDPGISFDPLAGSSSANPLFPTLPEWKCSLPGCQKLNNGNSKCCYMCGSLHR